MKTETLDEMIAELSESTFQKCYNVNVNREHDTRIIASALRSLSEKLLSREPSEAMLAAGWTNKEAFDAMRAVEREELGMK